jgi:hypothetical protein
MVRFAHMPVLPPISALRDACAGKSLALAVDWDGYQRAFRSAKLLDQALLDPEFPAFSHAFVSALHVTSS